MIYPYSCIQCGRDYEIVKASKDCAREEVCEDCNLTLQRVYTVPMVSVPLGSKRDFSEANKKYMAANDGSEMVPIGNDREYGRKLAPKKQSYDDIPREIKRKLEDI